VLDEVEAAEAFLYAGGDRQALQSQMKPERRATPSTARFGTWKRS